jgi:hypothetical protein
MCTGDTRYSRVLYSKLTHGVSQQAVRDVVGAAAGSEALNVFQFEEWEKLCKFHISTEFQLESILRENRVIGVRLSVGKVIRNAILRSKECLLLRVQKAQVINIVIYVDSRRMTKHTGSSIFNIACIDLGELVLQQKHIHYIAMGDFKDKAVDIRRNLAGVHL